MTIFWLIFTVVMAMLEAATVQLVSIWFAAGGLAACITSLITDNILIQIGIFLGVTVLTLVLTRPIVKRIKEKNTQPTNSDKYIGQTGIVLEEIDNEKAQGLVRVGSSKWTAKSVDNSVIAKDQKVKVLLIEGVKLIVEAENNSTEEI
ncbi:MAG: NfeD family protein [Ruminococcus sp.]|nr:NfeD family protein [Ruminococcus sp.]